MRPNYVLLFERQFENFWCQRECTVLYHGFSDQNKKMCEERVKYAFL